MLVHWRFSSIHGIMLPSSACPSVGSSSVALTNPPTPALSRSPFSTYFTRLHVVGVCSLLHPSAYGFMCSRGLLQGLQTVVGAFTTFVDQRTRMGFEVFEVGSKARSTSPEGPNTPSPEQAAGPKKPHPVVQAELVTIYPIVLIPPGWIPPANVSEEGGYVPRPRKKIRTDFDDLLPNSEPEVPQPHVVEVASFAKTLCSSIL